MFEDDFMSIISHLSPAGAENFPQYRFSGQKKGHFSLIFMWAKELQKNYAHVRVLFHIQNIIWVFAIT
ncbi:MAG: hypothetical protein JNJ41_07510 [Bacteroidia bacterium]|nr:hypothetical protein [Bacteroidia bacterium]